MMKQPRVEWSDMKTAPTDQDVLVWIPPTAFSPTLATPARFAVGPVRKTDPGAAR